MFNPDFELHSQPTPREQETSKRLNSRERPQLNRVADQRIYYPDKERSCEVTRCCTGESEKD
jgi:hypothetical protein